MKKGQPFFKEELKRCQCGRKAIKITERLPSGGLTLMKTIIRCEGKTEATKDLPGCNMRCSASDEETAIKMWNNQSQKNRKVILRLKSEITAHESAMNEQLKYRKEDQGKIERLEAENKRIEKESLAWYDTSQKMKGEMLKRQITINNLKAENKKLRGLLDEAMRGLSTARGTTQFYGGENVCPYCGTENNSHHMAVCPFTAYEIIKQALTDDKESE